MNVSIFAVYDTCSENYLQPFFAHNRGSAIRMFVSAASDPSSNFHKYANEYILYQIGLFDDTTAQIIPSHPDRIGTALELRIPASEPSV